MEKMLLSLFCLCLILVAQACVNKEKANAVGKELKAYYQTNVCKKGLKPGSSGKDYDYLMKNILQKYLSKSFTGCDPPGNLQEIVTNLKPCNKKGDDYCKKPSQDKFSACAKNVVEDKGYVAGLGVWLLGCCGLLDNLINNFKPAKMNQVKKEIVTYSGWKKKNP